jgi:hypothetical protein
MKTATLKSATPKALRTFLFASACAAALTLQPAFADDKLAPPAGPKPEHCPMMEHGDHAAHVQQKLDELGQKLHLKDNQQSAWKEYRGYITEASAEHTKMMGDHGKDMHEKMSNLPAPERLQKAADKMREGADALDKLAKRTATFYKTLSPEQQTIFDLYAHQMHGGMHMMQKHHE